MTEAAARRASRTRQKTRGPPGSEICSWPPVFPPVTSRRNRSALDRLGLPLGRRALGHDLLLATLAAFTFAGHFDLIAFDRALVDHLHFIPSHRHDDVEGNLVAVDLAV